MPISFNEFYKVVNLIIDVDNWLNDLNDLMNADICETPINILMEDCVDRLLKQLPQFAEDKEVPDEVYDEFWNSVIFGGEMTIKDFYDKYN